MADCQSAGTACERQQGGLPWRGRQGGRSSTTALLGLGASPARPQGAPHTWVGDPPSQRREAARTPP
eukprot:15445811-Alexandrium_andersonii.AAC.1